jgi:hypothetical protein
MGAVPPDSEAENWMVWAADTLADCGATVATVGTRLMLAASDPPCLLLTVALTVTVDDAVIAAGAV